MVDSPTIAGSDRKKDRKPLIGGEATPPPLTTPVARQPN